MRRAFTVAEFLIVMVIMGLIVGVVLPVIVGRRANQEKKPISYAMKNTPTYLVEVRCLNCKKRHEVETSVGVTVKLDHICPWCGVKVEFTVLEDGN